jgi:hypothetical protein
MEAGLIKEVKRAALDDDKNVYEIVEDATRKWLAGRAKKARANSLANAKDELARELNE